MADLEFKNVVLKKIESFKKTDSYELFNVWVTVDNKEEKFSAFDSIGKKEGSKSLTIDKITMGKEYSIGFTTNEKGFKTITFIQVPKSDRPKSKFNKGFDNKTGDLKIVKFDNDPNKYTECYEEYIELCKKQKKPINLLQFEAYFLTKYHQELGITELMCFLTDVFETKVKDLAESQRDMEEQV